MAPTHAIFQGPFNVKLEFVKRKKPEDYILYPGTKTQGESIDVWQVQTKSFPEVDPGLVSTFENFVTTPDAEVISGGINGKGPTSVAIGRHGNFFLWGFSAAPKDMTPSARNAFLNAVCYIDKFDGKTAGPINYDYAPSRESMLNDLYYMRSVSDMYINPLVEKYRETIKRFPPPEEQLKEIGDDPAAYFRGIYAKLVDERRNQIPADVRKLCGDDTEKLIAYYEENMEYLRKDERGFLLLVDEDARRLGISNRQVKLLEKCIALLDDAAQSALAIRLLQRYTSETFKDAAAWRKWWQSQRDNLRFDARAQRFVTSGG